MSQPNFTADERVMHKLLGAAYQMTFEEEYSLASETADLAVRFHTRDDPPSYPDQQATAPAATDGSGVLKEPEDEDDQQLKLPGRGTKTREGVVCLLNAHHAGTEWASLQEIREFQTQAGVDQTLSATASQSHYPWVQRKKTDNGQRFRIDPRVRDELKDQLLEGSE